MLKRFEMKHNTKKIIAREFLILTLVLILALLCFFGTYLYNYYRESQSDKLKKIITEKTKLVDSLSHSYNLKNKTQNLFYDKFKAKFTDAKEDSKEKVWNRLNDLAVKDSIKFKWEHSWEKEVVAFNREQGFNTPEEFKEFIEANRINTSEIENYTKSINLNQEISTLNSEKNEAENKVLLFSEQIDFAIKSLLLFAVIFFGLRFLFYGIKWSIKTLKQKPE